MRNGVSVIIVLLAVLMSTALPAIACREYAGSNAAPVAVADESYAYENEIQTGSVGLNDTDPNGDVLTYSVIAQPDHGTITMQPNGQFTYLPDFLYYGLDYVTYQVCDPHGACASAILEIAVLFVNDPPAIVDETFFLVANTPFTGSIAVNDFDIDIEPIFYNVLVAPAHVTGFQLSALGIVSFTPNPGFTGTITLVYQGCDPCVVCDIGVATFVVQNNQSPTAQDDSEVTSMNASLSLSVAVNDSDPEGQVLAYSVIAQPQHGNITMNVNGSYVYTPVASFAGTDVITYQACDTFGACDQASLTITVVSVNISPNAADDAFNMDEDGTFTGQVALNDTDPNTDDLSFYVVAPPAQGTLSWNEQTGAFVYIPPSQFSGTVSFVYSACDPFNSCDQAYVSITVSAVNDPPVALPSLITGTEDITTTGALASLVTDQESGVIVFSVLAPPAMGALVINPDGTFSYTPAVHFNGTVTFQYQACDGGALCASAMVTIDLTAVNDSPVVNGQSFSTNEDVVLSGSVATNDSDPEGQPLIYSSTLLPASGTLVLAPNGSFVFTPAPDYNGVVSFTYQACDEGGLCGTGTATIGVGAVNDLPAAGDGSAAMNEDTPFSGSLLSLASDTEGSALLFSVAMPPASGQLSVQPSGQFTFTPALNFNGTVSFVYQACDGQGLCDQGTFTLSVLPVNDIPVVLGETRVMNEDAILNSSVAGNDSDAEPGPLSYSLLQGPASGILVLQSNGSFTYTPVLHFSGWVSFTYQACDAGGLCGSATASVQVVWINDLPVAGDDMFMLTEDQPFTASVAGNDLDVDIEPLLFSTLMAPSQGLLSMEQTGVFTYTPSANFSGFVSFLYLACDTCNACDAGLVSLLIQPVNDAPLPLPDSFTGNEDTTLSGSVAINDNDIEGDQLTYTLFSPPAVGILNLGISGSFMYTPPAHFHGMVEAVYQVCDAQGACALSTLSLVILPVNDIPIVLGESNSALMNTPLSGILSSNDSDSDGDALTYTLVLPPASGVLTLGVNGSYTYTPSLNFSGSVSAGYSACDPSGACAMATLTIQVISTNTPPVVLSETLTTNEDGVLSGSVAVNDNDADGQPLFYSFSSSPPVGVWTTTPAGAVQFSPPVNWNGTFTIPYVACDPIGACVSAVLTVVVVPVNDAPVAVGEALATTEDDPLSSTVAGNDSDPDGDILAYTLLTTPQHGTIVMQANGAFTYIPEVNYFGTDQCIYQACDASGACATAVLSLVVIFVNDLPIANDDVHYLLVNELTTGSVAINDIELDPEPLTYTIILAASNGQFSLQPNGSFTYIPNDGFLGTDVVVYLACDPCGACDTGILQLVVGAENNPPFAGSVSSTSCSGSVWSIDLDSYISDLEDPNSALSITVYGNTGGSWQVDDISHVVQLLVDPFFTGTAAANYTVCDLTLGTQCTGGQIEVNIESWTTPEILSAEITPSSCFTLPDGQIDLTTDSNANIYVWSDGTDEEDLTDAAGGIYTVTITRDGDCVIPLEAQFGIPSPEPLVVSSVTPVGISGSPGGSTLPEVTGGVPPYTYRWVRLADGEVVSTSPQLEGLDSAGMAGGYELFVTDANGCEEVVSIVVTDVTSHSAPVVDAYPNPNSGLLTIHSDTWGLGALVVRDNCGRIVYRDDQFRIGGIIALDLTSLAAGSYILEWSGGGQPWVWRMVRQ